MKPHRSWFYGLSAVVTGASDGMGRIIAEKLITVFGCRVIGIARSADKLINVKNGLGDLSGRFEYIAADVSDAAFWKDLGARLIRENSAVDILINNAGVMPPFIPLRDTAEEVFERTTDVNYKAVYYSIKKSSARPEKKPLRRYRKRFQRRRSLPSCRDGGLQRK